MAGALPLLFSRKSEIIFNFLKKKWILQNSEILKSFSNFNTISINFNIFFKTIMIIHKDFKNAMTFRNHFFMVKSICVQPPVLACLATVSVLWQRAVNREPGYRSGNSKGRSPPTIIFQEIRNFQKISSFFNFFKKFRSCRTLKFQSHFHVSIPFL